MKKKLARQKRRLFAVIAVSLFALSVLVFGVFALITYNSEKNTLEINALANFNAESNTVIEFDLLNNIDYQKYIMNFGDVGDYQTKIINGVTGEVISETQNALAVEFWDEGKNSIFGCIDYETFRDSINGEDFEKIVSYLTLPIDVVDGYYYELLCTQFYEDEGEIIPKTVEIVKTRDVHTWYVQDEVIESIELYPLNDDDAQLYKIGETYRNKIDSDFVQHGKAEYENLTNKLMAMEGVDDPFSLEVGCRRVEPFTYIYYDASGFYLGDNYYIIQYAERFNVLEGCIGTLTTMLVYIVVIFSVVGIIVGAIIWKTMKKQIVQENRLRTVTSSMAHELKTPLFVIGGFAESLSENINTDKREHYARLITQQTKQMNTLVSRMIEYSKLDSVGFKLNKEKICLTDIVKQIAEKYTFSQIRLDCQGKVFIAADKGLMQTAVESLVENAVKYSDGSDDIVVKCTASAFSVSNPYREVSEAEVANMWEPYHRSNEESDKQGNGIGLAMVKSIANLHGMKCISNYNSGTITFGFEF